MLAALWRTIIVTRAQRKRSGEKWAPPTTTARAVPKTTGIADAGRDQGRAATSHFFKAVLSVVGEGVSSMNEFIPQAWESGKGAPIVQ
jgi:hypothetical protein